MRDLTPTSDPHITHITHIITEAQKPNQQIRASLSLPSSPATLLTHLHLAWPLPAGLLLAGHRGRPRARRAPPQCPVLLQHGRRPAVQHPQHVVRRRHARPAAQHHEVGGPVARTCVALSAARCHIPPPLCVMLPGSCPAALVLHPSCPPPSSHPALWCQAGCAIHPRRAAVFVGHASRKPAVAAAVLWPLLCCSRCCAAAVLAVLCAVALLWLLLCMAAAVLWPCCCAAALLWPLLWPLLCPRPLLHTPLPAAP